MDINVWAGFERSVSNAVRAIEEWVLIFLCVGFERSTYSVGGCYNELNGPKTQIVKQQKKQGGIQVDPALLHNTQSN